MSKEKSVSDRISYLKQCDVAYEEGNPLTDDEAYDIEKEEVRAICPNHEYFQNVGGLSEETHGWQEPYTHKYPMGSLQKDKSPELTEDWLVKTYPETNGLVLILQPKLDGSSICNRFDNKKLERIVSRGDGFVGFDISTVARNIADIPFKINEKGYVEVKGECVKDKASFYKIWAPQGYNDPRSFVPGTLNAKPDENTPKEMKEKGISFIAYEVRGKEFKTETEKLKFLVDNGFKTLKDFTLKINCTGKTHKEIVAIIKKYMADLDRDNFVYQLDGIVIKNDDVIASEKLGVVSRRPKGSRAVKFECEQGETVAQTIAWETGKSGVVTPVANLKPLFLAGATISRATLHNIKEMARLGIDKLPYRVILIRSGDIIPKIIKGIAPEPNAKDIVFPKVCPTCSCPLVWDKTETNKVCPSIACPAQLSGKIDYYLKTIGVKGIGSSTIDTLIDKEYVTVLSDMYNLAKHKDELSNVFGDRAFANILEAMDGVKEVTLPTFISSLSIANIGTMSKDLPAKTIEEVDGLTVSDIIAVDGFGPTKSQSFVSGWKNMRGEIAVLLKHIKIKEVEVKKGKATGVSGKKFLITGTLSVGRREFEAMIVENGGLIASSVSKNLDFLIVGEDCGSKKDKAEKLGIPIISEDEFKAML